MNVKGIIFDLDGVVLSTDHFHYLAWKSLADELGIPFTEKDNEKLRGVSRMASFEIILSTFLWQKGPTFEISGRII